MSTKDLETLRKERSERLDTAISLQEPDRVPFMPKTSGIFMLGYGISFYDAMKDARLMIPGFQQFMADYAESVKFVQENVEEAAGLIGQFDIFEAGPAQKALPYCNIVFIDGEDMKTRLGGYLAALLEQDPAAVGGAVPGEDFYY